MDPWVSAAIVARSCRRARVAICDTNLLSRHPAVSAAAIASLEWPRGARHWRRQQRHQECGACEVLFYLPPMIGSAAVVRECVGFWLQYTVSFAAFFFILSKSIIGGSSSSK